MGNSANLISSEIYNIKVLDIKENEKIKSGRIDYIFDSFQSILFSGFCVTKSYHDSATGDIRSNCNIFFLCNPTGSCEVITLIIPFIMSGEQASYLETVFNNYHFSPNLLFAINLASTKCIDNDYAFETDLICENFFGEKVYIYGASLDYHNNDLDIAQIQLDRSKYFTLNAIKTHIQSFNKNLSDSQKFMKILYFYQDILSADLSIFDGSIEDVVDLEYNVPLRLPKKSIIPFIKRFTSKTDIRNPQLLRLKCERGNDEFIRQIGLNGGNKWIRNLCINSPTCENIEKFDYLYEGTITGYAICNAYNDHNDIHTYIIFGLTERNNEKRSQYYEKFVLCVDVTSLGESNKIDITEVSSVDWYKYFLAGIGRTLYI